MITARFKQFQVIANEHGVVSGIFGLDQNGELWSRRESDGEWTKLRMPERQVDNRTPFEKLLDAQEQLRAAQAEVDESGDEAQVQTDAPVISNGESVDTWRNRMRREHGSVKFTHMSRMDGDRLAAVVDGPAGEMVVAQWDIENNREM